jgi:hypothetical protein
VLCRVAGKNDWYRLHRYLEVALLQRKEREQGGGGDEGSCAAPTQAPSTSAVAAAGSKEGGGKGGGEGQVGGEGENTLAEHSLKREREEIDGSEGGGDRQDEDSSSLLTGECGSNPHWDISLVVLPLPLPLSIRLSVLLCLNVSASPCV